MPRKALILVKDFPPLKTAGARRPEAWAKYLSAGGIEPIIITSTPPEKETSLEKNIYRVNTPILNSNRILRKFHSGLQSVIPYYFISSSDLAPLMDKAEDIIKSTEINYIIASGEPFILFQVARKLGKKFNIPWIADYRDVWTNNPEITVKNFIWKLLYSLVYRPREKKWLKSAAMITTAAETYRKKIKTITHHPRIDVIFNGNDITWPIKGSPSKDKFRIGYSGRLYAFQPIEEFLSAFSEFVNKMGNPDNIELNFFGLEDFPHQLQRVQSQAESLHKYINYFPGVDYQTYIENLTKSQILLILTQSHLGWLNAKSFDYLALKGRILLYPDKDGELEFLLRKEDYIASNKEDITKFLLHNYDLFSHQKEASSSLSTVNYSRKNSTLKLADLLNSLEH